MQVPYNHLTCKAYAIFKKLRLCSKLNSSKPNDHIFIIEFVELMACRLFCANPSPKPKVTYNWTLVNKLSEIRVKIQNFSLTKMHMKCLLQIGGHFALGSSQYKASICNVSEINVFISVCKWVMIIKQCFTRTQCVGTYRMLLAPMFVYYCRAFRWVSAKKT